MRLRVRSFKNFQLIVFVRRSAKRRSLAKAIFIVGCRYIVTLAERAVRSNVFLTGNHFPCNSYTYTSKEKRALVLTIISCNTLLT
jgi:hypothetical protein